MKIAIIGGKLQATEACYLARACGMESILIDYDSSVPARGIADVFVCADVAAKDERAVKAMKEVDLVLPANENDRVLKAICEICAENSIHQHHPPASATGIYLPPAWPSARLRQYCFQPVSSIEQ